MEETPVWTVSSIPAQYILTHFAGPARRLFCFIGGAVVSLVRFGLKIADDMCSRPKNFKLGAENTYYMYSNWNKTPKPPLVGTKNILLIKELLHGVCALFGLILTTALLFLVLQ
jgi:hypothetical protein